MDNTQKPLLSIGMIVKNESRCLEKCLKALQPLRDAFPCELVIADTGSTDNTKEIAAHYADILFDFPWINDFAAARNAVMDRCSGQWYLSIDADEYLDPDLSGFYSLFQLDKTEWPTNCYVTVRSYSSLDFEHSDFTNFLVYRIAQLGIGIHFSGSIHEVLTTPKSSGKESTVLCLPQIILHHDGYAYQTEEEKKSKGKRNLELLDEELKKNPRMGYRRIQCLETSSAFPEKEKQYALKGMEYLQAGEIEGDNLYEISSILATRCTIVAIKFELEEAEDWIRWTFEHYSDTLAVQVELSCAATLYYYTNNDYKNVLKYSEIYQTGLNKYRQNQFPIAQFLTTIVQNASSKYEYKVRSITGYVQAVMHMEEDALSQLSGWPFEKLSEDILLDWLKALLPLWHRTEAAAMTSELIQYLLTSTDESKWFQQRKNAVRDYALNLFLQSTTDDTKTKNGWQLFLSSPGLLGVMARILDTNIVTQVEELLQKVEDWPQFSPAVAAHAFDLGARFPDSLMKQGQSLKQKLIANLSNADPQFNESVKVWLENNQGESLPRTRFVYHVLIAALQQGEKLSQEQILDFTRLFIKIADKSLHRLYHPDLWGNEEDQFELPMADRYAICILNAKQKYEEKDFSGCVNDLHKALKIAPSMKYVVDIILKQVEEKVSASRLSETASKELLELADKVRTILAQYPPDDPSVVALKQSEVYQKVAYLIEGMEAPVFGGLPQ